MRHIIAFGEIANQLVSENNNRFPIHKFKTLNQAFDQAVSLANQNDSVLLSPGTASYDQYASYIERGKDFNKLVTSYESKTVKK